MQANVACYAAGARIVRVGEQNIDGGMQNHNAKNHRYFIGIEQKKYDSDKIICTFLFFFVTLQPKIEGNHAPVV